MPKSSSLLNQGSQSQNYYWYRSGLKLSPYLVLGIIIFAFNSQTDLNYMFRGYFTLLEAQVGLVLIYFLTARLTKRAAPKAKETEISRTIP